MPTVFITLQKDGHTWVPDTGDEIETEEEIGHPSLERITDEVQKSEPQSVVEPPENKESPETVDDSKEN